MRRLAPALVLACLFVGCGDSEPAGPKTPVEAYKQLFAAWKNHDVKTACALMSTSYQHKLAAELEDYSADCPGLITEIHKQMVGKDAIKQLSVEAGDENMVLARMKLTDGIVRTRFEFQRRDGKWVVADDFSLDATGPQAPVEDYRRTIKGDPPEILWSEMDDDKKNARLWEIAGNGKGSWTLTAVGLRYDKVDHEWKVVRKEALGTAPDTVSSDGNVV
jgi:hypothetical protein